MTLRDLLIQIGLKFVFAVLFIFFAIENVRTVGWGFFAFISVLFATNNIVQGARLLDTYFKIKKNLDDKNK